tara:strand:+ start:294 stop:548 length:255 start_codon:yes stop_codon:yes gene_type:complete
MYDFDQDPKRVKDTLFCSMSAQFLTNELPVEAIDWENEKIEEWIDENKWYPFEDWDTQLIVELIESAAWHVYDFMKNNFEEMVK